MAKKTVLIFLLLCAVVVLFFVNAVALGTTHYVDPDGNDLSDGLSWTNAFATIQKGIDSSGTADIVEVNEGTYEGYVDFNDKAITVRSIDPNDWDVVSQTVIDGGVSSIVITFSGEDVTSEIHGFTLKGENLSVVDCVGKSTPVISRCVIQGADYGVICFRETAVEIHNCKITGNDQGIRLGKNHLTKTSVIKNNWIYGNGHGIALTHNSSPLVSNNTIVNNTSWGISRLAHLPDPNIINCILWGNGVEDLNDNFSAAYSCISDSFDVNDPNFEGSISSDPCFVDADSNDFHLKVGSLCRNAGDPNGSYDGQIDIDREQRVAWGQVDIGADEWVVELRVDTDRDSNITVADESGEDSWSVGSGSVGAIVLPNCDKDNTTKNAPDNWTGGDWDLDGTAEANEAANNEVDNADDIDDLAELWVYKFGEDTFDPDLKITLKVEKVTGENEFFADCDAEDRIRIFEPTDSSTESNNLIIQAGDEAIIGPNDDDGDSFIFTATSNPNYNIFAGSGIVKFGVEGIEFGAYVDITITAELNDVNEVIGTDTVRMRVAPFVLSDHNMPIDTTAGLKTVYIKNAGSNNSDVRDALRDKYGDPNDANDPNGNLDYCPDTYPRDHFMAGYVKAPYGEMPIFIVMDWGYTNGPANAKYVHNERLGSGVGVCSRLKGISSLPGLAYCSYVDSKPADSNRPGNFAFTETYLDSNIVEFFEAQGVNKKLPVDIDWTIYGHLIEIFSFAPDREHTFVVDPEVCWGLLLWANQIDPDAMMRQGMRYGDPPWYLADGNGLKVSDVLTYSYGGVSLKSYNIAPDEDDPSIVEDLLGHREDPDLGMESPESTPVNDVNNSSTTVLIKAGGFVGFFPDSNDRYYQIEFDNATNTNEYTLEWSYDQDTWNDPCVGVIDEDSVFPEARCFILKHWWWKDVDDSSSAEPEYGDKFTFEVDADCNTIEIPMLFMKDGTNGAASYTINHIISCMDVDTVFTEDPCGPKVDYLGTGASDILMDYVEKAHEKGGINDVNFADTRWYYNSYAGVNCGTMEQREIPDYDWWDFDPNQ